MRKQIALGLATVALGLASGAAHASKVYWSIGISAPPVGTVISNAPVYAPAPVVVAPVYAPPPAVVYEPAPVVYAPPPPVMVEPRVVYPAGYYYGHGWRHHHHHDEYGERYDDRRWQPVPPDWRRQHHDDRDR